MDWKEWHDAYDRADSVLVGRLRVVQQQIRNALDECPAGAIRVISLCAGQGRDLLGALADHPRRADITARLVELNPHNVTIGRQLARTSGLSNCEFKVGDAAVTDHYQGLVPANIVLACGVFGNLSSHDLHSLIAHLPQLCQTGGTVVWTRSRHEPDWVPQVCELLQEHGFDPQWLSDPADFFGVGRHRLSAPNRPLDLGVHMFEFLANDALAQRHTRQSSPKT